MVNNKRMCSFFIIYTGVDPEYILILLIFCMLQVVNLAVDFLRSGGKGGKDPFAARPSLQLSSSLRKKCSGLSESGRE
mgnify:CR=1 FL=1